MKKLFVALIFALNLFATAPQFNVYDINDAMRLSSQYNRPVIFVIASNKCSHCVNYLNAIASDQRLSALIRAKYIFALSIIDQGGTIPSGIQFRGITPTTTILRGNRALTQPIEGELSSEDLTRLLYTFN